jgi:hypothetical protein
MRIEKALREEILNEIEELGKCSLGTEEHKIRVDGAAKLMDKAIEIEKLNIEQENKEKDRELEKALKLQQMEEERKDRKTKNVLTALGIGIPAVITVWGTLKTFAFEKDENVTTLIGRGFINKLLPKK